MFLEKYNNYYPVIQTFGDLIFYGFEPYDSTGLPYENKKTSEYEFTGFKFISKQSS
jgi:hypothetical protein